MYDKFKSDIMYKSKQDVINVVINAEMSKDDNTSELLDDELINIVNEITLPDLYE